MKSKTYCSLPNCHNYVWIWTVTLLYTSSKSHEIRLLNYHKHPFFFPLHLILFAHFHPQCFHLINLLHNKHSIRIPWEPLQNCFKIGNCKNPLQLHHCRLYMLWSAMNSMNPQVAPVEKALLLWKVYPRNGILSTFSLHLHLVYMKNKTPGENNVFIS